LSRECLDNWVPGRWPAALKCLDTVPSPLPAFQPVKGKHVVEIRVVAVDLGFGFN
jgi:hypothetical protein